MKCFHFIIEHSDVPIASLFESSSYVYTEDFLGADVFGQGYYGVDLALTDLAIEVIKMSGCEPAGDREDMCIWYDMWHEAGRRGLPPTADEPTTWVNRILSLGIAFVPFSWPLLDEDGIHSDDLCYHRWLLELCLGNGGNPNSELAFANDYVPLEFALYMAADVRLEDPDEYDCNDIAYSLLSPLIDAGADIYYIREDNGGLRSVTELAFSLGLDHCWYIALSDGGLDFDSVIEEDERNLLLRRHGETAAVTGIDVESIKPERSGLRRRN